MLLVSAAFGEANVSEANVKRAERAAGAKAHRPRLSTMLYRENGQFKSSYAADQLLPIAQDRWFVVGLIAFAYWPCRCLRATTCFAR